MQGSETKSEEKEPIIRMLSPNEVSQQVGESPKAFSSRDEDGDEADEFIICD